MNKNLRQMYYDLVALRVIDLEKDSVPVSIWAGFYVILSQYFKKVKIAYGSDFKELRLSYFEILPSRFGKGELLKVMKDVLNNLNISWAKITRISEAGLIGTINEKAIEYNYKNKLKEGDKNYINPVIKGDIANFDVLFFEEAKKLLLLGDKDDVLGDLQEALDYPGHIRKKLRYEYPIEYDTTVSIYCTTYYCPEITKTLLTQGFFNRLPFRVRDATAEENLELRHDVIDLFKKDKNRRKNYLFKLEEFCNEVKKLNNSERVIYINDKAIRYMHDIINRFHKEILKSRGEEMKILMSFSQNIIDMCTKIGGINCCAISRNEINEQDIQSAFAFVKSVSVSLINKVLSQNIEDSKREKIKKSIINLYRKLYLKNQNINKEEFIKYLKNNGVNICRNKLLIIIDGMIKENYFRIEKGKKNEHLLMLEES